MKVILTTIAVILLLAVIAFVIMLFYRASLSRSVSPDLGVVSGKLMACPDSPNCVSSYAKDPRHAVLALNGGADEFELLSTHIVGLPKVTAVTRSQSYLWVTYRSGFFGFIDDLELYFDGDSIQVRSASRQGYSDLGVNRKRVEALRTFLAEK